MESVTEDAVEILAQSFSYERYGVSLADNTPDHAEGNRSLARTTLETIAPIIASAERERLLRGLVAGPWTVDHAAGLWWLSGPEGSLGVEFDTEERANACRNILNSL